MTKNGKCLWIVETLLQAGALSLRELNERWERSALYDGHRIQERTFRATRSILQKNMPSTSTIRPQPTRMTLSIGKRFATMRSTAICSRPTTLPT